MFRAIIVDDEELAIRRLRSIIAQHGDIEVCDAFMNPVDAHAYVKKFPIDLAFLDISMPEINGMRLSNLLLQLNSDTDIIFVTGYDNYAVQAFDMSALDYLMKPVTERRISKTLEKVRRKHARVVIPPDADVGRTERGILTWQEIKVLQLISNGFSNKEIAVQLNISADTVKYHIKNLYKKFSINNRVQLVKRAKETGISV